MKSKGVLEVLAGQASIVTILVLVLFLSVAATPMLQQSKVVAQHIGTDVAVAKAHAIAEALLSGADGTRRLDADEKTFTARHYPNALETSLQSRSPDEETAGVLERLRANPLQPQIEFTEVAGNIYLRYAVSDRRGGALLLNLRLDRERAAIGRFFGQSYLASSSVGLILIALLLFASFALRHYLRGLVRLPQDERSELIRETLAADLQRRNLLPWMLTLCLLVFAFDLTNTMDGIVGIGYLVAVTLCLSSSRPWHIMMVAAVSCVLLFVAPLVSAYDSGWWAQLERHSVTVFAILASGLYGSAHMRKSRAEALALAEAAQSRNETEALRAALARAEAAEAELHRTADRMTLANRAAGISTWHWDMRTDMVEVQEGSPFVERIGGTTRISGADYREQFVLKEDHAAYIEAVRVAATQPESHDLARHRYRIRTSDGSIRHVQFQGRILRSNSGKMVGMLGVDWDVTREEEAFQKIERQACQLREMQDRLQRATSGTQDALFEIDTNSGECWVSPRFYEMTGYSSERLDLSIQSLYALIHPEDVPRVRAMTDAHFKHNEPYDIEYRLLCSNDRYLWLRSRASAQRDASNRATLLSGSLHDITEARAAREALLRASEEAEAASRAKSTFLATMSHEIRTPMNGVIGMTGLLLDTQLDRVQRDYAETIRASADSLLTIINDILDFSKIEAGKLDIETLDMDLMANVDEVGSMMAFQAAAKGLELVVNVRPEVPERVVGDPQRLRQCLLNLVGNAIKFTQTGEVVVEVCSLGRQNGRALVHFEVRDTGIGIPQETLGKLFQPFTQADSSTTRRFGGTGLGLSIVHKLVELMGGRVGAHSEVGKGSAFWFTLPLEASLSSNEEERAPQAPSGKRVLLVDDNETNRRVLSAQMAHAGYQVEMVPSAPEALTILRDATTEPFDIVVLDFQMPDMDGASLGQQIVSDRSIPPARLILLTSLDRSGDIQRFADIGFAAYLTKPVRARELLDCLGKSLARDAQDWHMRSQPIITRNTLMASEGKRQYHGRVMLVEDNAINQRVAHRFLERLGCEVHVVENGLQAVEASSAEPWALILMDMQMPVMDGLEATRRIRELENGQTRTPIVALTANAMLGQLERCLEAGMDDYLTKPLDINRLQDVLDRFMRGAPTDEQILATPAPASDTAVSVRSRLMEIADGDGDFAAELITAFLLGTDESMAEMKAAASMNDSDALARAAHKVKGASANLYIESLAELARDLETRARSGAANDWRSNVDRIAEDYARVAATLRELLAEMCPAAAASA